MSRSTGHLSAIAPAICALVLLVARAEPAWAQDSDPGIYGRAGVTVPAGDLGSFTETGPSLRVGARLLDDGRFALVGEAGVELLAGERMDVRVVPVQAGVRLRLPAPGERLSASVLGLAGATFHQKGGREALSRHKRG